MQKGATVEPRTGTTRAEEIFGHLAADYLGMRRKPEAPLERLRPLASRLDPGDPLPGQEGHFRGCQPLGFNQRVAPGGPDQDVY